MNNLIPLVAVVGPTASGKTDLAVKIALKNNGEIVSFDSMQIYRDAPIATAIPTIEERMGVPHHLMEFVSPNEQFSVAKYVELAHRTIAQIHEIGKLPVLVGGTGLYYSALLDHLQFSQETVDHQPVRQRLQQRLATEGIQALYHELLQIDPQAAKKIHINNQVRVMRALEIYYVTGQTMTRQVEQSKQTPSPYFPCVLGLTYHDRNLLYDRINRRVFQMIEAGVVEEVRRIYELNPTGTLMQAIGVKEFVPYFRGEVTLEQTVETIQMNTRRYAKRQLTWFRRDQRVHWLYRDDPLCVSDLFGQAQEIVQNFF